MAPENVRKLYVSHSYLLFVLYFKCPFLHLYPFVFNFFLFFFISEKGEDVQGILSFQKRVKGKSFFLFYE